MQRFIYVVIFLAAILGESPLYAQTPSVSIDIVNIGSLDKAQLLQSLSIYRYRDSTYLSDDLIQRLVKKGIDELKISVQTLGYYQTVISSQIDHVKDSWKVTYSMKLGDPVRIKNISIVVSGEGENDEFIKKWKNNFPLKPTQTMNQLKYENAKTELIRTLFNRGYFNYRFITHKILINPDENSAVIEINIDTGNRFNFGKVFFKQKDNTFENRYLDKFIAFQTGDPFISSALIATQNNFASSDEFQSIEIEPLVDKKHGNDVPVSVSLIARKPIKLEYGAGYATDTGPRASASIERKRITRSGHRANVSFQLSRVKSTFNVGYRIPLKKPYSDFLSFSGKRETEDSDTVKSQKNTISLNTTYTLASWLRTAFINYESEHYEIGDGINDSILLIPGIQFDYLHKVIPPKTKMHWRLSLSLKGAYDRIISDTSFAQAYASGWIRLPFSEKARFIAHSKIGHSWTSEFEELPASQRFFTGGDYTVRGYAYNSLGPEDANGKVLGGENLVVGSIEFQHQIMPDIDASIFYDTGNAFNKNDLTLKSGAGVGIGWNFPFGSLHLYRAVALSEPGHPWRFHLTVGADI